VFFIRVLDGGLSHVLWEQGWLWRKSHDFRYDAGAASRYCHTPNRSRVWMEIAVMLLRTSLDAPLSKDVGRQTDER